MSRVSLLLLPVCMVWSLFSLTPLTPVGLTCYLFLSLFPYLPKGMVWGYFHWRAKPSHPTPTLYLLFGCPIVAMGFEPSLPQCNCSCEVLRSSRGSFVPHQRTWGSH